MPVLTSQQQAQFREDGFCVLPGVIDAKTLTWLREECAYFHGYMDAFMDHQGVTTYGITHRDQRYFISQRYRLSRRLPNFLFGALMADICRDALGGEANLFGEQWVLKGADQGMKFSWHQDSGYLATRTPGTEHRPYLTCWCTLDDVDEANGTVYVLPHTEGGTRDRIFEHVEDPRTNDLVGYHGDATGVPVIAPAGSIVIFTSFNFHRSGPNTTDRMRRVYLAQYSAERVIHPDGVLCGMCVPFLRDGQVIYDAANDTVERHGPHAKIPGAAKTSTR